MKLIALLAVTLCLACSGAMTANDGPKLEPNGDHTDMRVNGPLRLDLRDFTSPPGIMFALPSVTPGTGNLVVENTRYGSLCRFDVSGRANVKGHTIGVHIGFGERLTLCTAEIRALTYKATLSVPAGSYDVAVIHENGNEADTLVKRAVTVR